MISMPSPVIVSVQFDQLKVVVIISSSPIRLVDGGKAKLAKFIISHQNVMSGRITCIPRARIMVRLWVRS